MPTREQLISVLQTGDTYEEAAKHFGIPPGQAYLIATGLPADGSDVLPPEELEQRKGLLLDGSSQHLANPPTEVVTEDESVQEWTRARAADDSAMQEAAAKRTAEPPPIDNPDQTSDVVDLLGRDHNQVKYLQEQLEAIPKDTERHLQQCVSIIDMMRIRLSQHEAAEEQYLWPAVRKHLPDGDELADQALEQEQHGKDLLQELDGMPGDDPRFEDLVTELSSALRKHVAFEDRVFLKVKESVPDKTRDQLGRKVEKAKANAPTRPHPHAPTGNKPAATVAAAAAAPLDYARDMLGDRPANRDGKAEGEEVTDE